LPNEITSAVATLRLSRLLSHLETAGLCNTTLQNLAETRKNKLSHLVSSKFHIFLSP